MKMNFPGMIKRVQKNPNEIPDNTADQANPQPPMQLEKLKLLQANDPELEEVLKQKGYTYIAPIGKGGTATCFLVKSQKYQMNFVCKKCYLDKSSLCSTCELEALKKLNSPKIINMYDFEITPTSIYLFLEYCPNGSLQDIVRSQGPLHGDQLTSVCKSILEGIDFIHSNHYAHLDIKPPNLLIDPYGRVKLADFGIARFVDHSDNFVNFHCGTLLFMSPELISHDKYDPFKADIWALGVTFYWMATGKYPWPTRKPDETKKAIQKGLTFFPPEFHNAEFKSIIRQMLDLSPQARPTARELLQLSTFSNCDKREAKLFIQPLQPMFRRNSIPTIGSMLNLLTKSSTDLTNESASNETEEKPQPGPYVLTRKNSVEKDLDHLPRKQLRKSIDNLSIIQNSGRACVRPKMLQLASSRPKMQSISEDN